MLSRGSASPSGSESLTPVGFLKSRLATLPIDSLEPHFPPFAITKDVSHEEMDCSHMFSYAYGIRVVPECNRLTCISAQKDG